MNLQTTILRVISLPRKFYQNGDVSIHSLLRDSGYFEMYELVSEEALCAAIYDHPEYINDWLSFSEDKRTSGWYFQRSSNEQWEVGYVSAGGGSIDAARYSDPARACASFVKHEVEDIRTT